MSEPLIAFYDTETTGRTGKDEVIQFGAIITDFDLKFKGMINEYCMSNRPIHPDAEAVHGISRKKMIEYSKGKNFEQVVEEHPLFRKEPNVVWVAYKDDFDRGKINDTLKNNGFPGINFGEKSYTFSRRNLQRGRYSVDALDWFSKTINHGMKTKLQQYLKNKEILKVDPQNFQYYFEGFVKKAGSKFPPGKHHDALFDAFTLWWIASHHKEKMLR